VEDKLTGLPRAKAIMKAGDVAAMPANIRHQGFSKKRSMLLVWENATPELPDMYESGKLQPLDVKVGDRILFSKYAGTEVKVDGEENLIMREDDILGVIEK